MARLGDEKVSDGPIRCPACGEHWHGGYRSGLFQFHEGYWYHWCQHAYNVCEVKENKKNDRNT